VRYVVALDVGGTGMKASLVAAGGEVAHAERRATGRERGPDAVVAGVLDFAADMAAEGERRLGTRPGAVGLALPGVVDEAAGVGVFSANIGWRDVPFRRLAQDRLGVPVRLAHDVRAGGVAEVRLGAARGYEHVLFLPIGTGIAAAMLLGGRPYAGAHGAGGEIGHVVVRPDGPACGCGARGCLETLASASAVARRYGEATGQNGISAAEVAGRAAAGDPAASAVWAQTVAALADGLVAYTSLLDPELVVVGGGLARSGEALLAPLREAVARRLTFQIPSRIVAAELGDEAGTLGAGLLAWDLLASASETAP
jgi:glucokinase